MSLFVGFTLSFAFLNICRHLLYILTEEKRNVEIYNAQSNDLKAQLQLKDHQVNSLELRNSQLLSENEVLNNRQDKNSEY